MGEAWFFMLAAYLAGSVLTAIEIRAHRLVPTDWIAGWAFVVLWPVWIGAVMLILVVRMFKRRSGA
jgi:hypothetical protein